MKLKISVVLIIAALLLGGYLLFRNSGSGSDGQGSNSNVSVVDGRQIVEITAKGGYRPQKSIAKAGLPTTIRFQTKGTFDCSSFVVIPDLKVSQNLSRSGSTDVDVGSPSLGTLTGSCAMGMYPFEVKFQN